MLDQMLISKWLINCLVLSKKKKKGKKKPQLQWRQIWRRADKCVEVSYLLSLSNFRWKVVTKEPTTTTTTTTTPMDSNNGCRVYNNPLLQTLPFTCLMSIHSHYHCLLCSALLCSALLYTLATILLYGPAASSAALLWWLFLTTQELLVTKLNMLWMSYYFPILSTIIFLLLLLQTWYHHKAFCSFAATTEEENLVLVVMMMMITTMHCSGFCYCFIEYNIPVAALVSVL